MYTLSSKRWCRQDFRWGSALHSIVASKRDELFMVLYTQTVPLN